MAGSAKDTRATIIPALRYRDAPAALEWLCEAFGFEKHLVVPGEDGTIAHAQLVFGNGMIMLGSARSDDFGRLQGPLAAPGAQVSQSPYIIVSDVDAHHATAVAAGAHVVMAPEDQDHGGRLYSCRDPEGNLWNFGSYDPWESGPEKGTGAAAPPPAAGRETSTACLSLRYRSAFPACEGRTYLNCAAVAPGSTHVRAALNAWLDDHVARGNLGSEHWWTRAAEARARAAELIGASPEEIAFVKSTSHGLAMVAEGLDWRPGDEVAVASALEYPSNVYAWRHLADRGVRLRELRVVDGAVTPESVEAAIGTRTRLVAVSSVQFASGQRTDLDAIGRLCRDRGVLFVVDAIQQAGAFPLDVKASGIHALAACSHKWMLGLLGIGFLFVDRDLLPQLRPVLVGWHSVEDPFAFDGTRFDLRTGGASRLEEAAPPFPLVYGLGAALDMLLDAGVANTAAHITALLERAAGALEAIGCEVSPPPEHRAGILMIKPPTDVDALAEACLERNIAVSVRRGRLRLSPHLYNNEDDVDVLLDLLRDRIPVRAARPAGARRAD